MTDFTPRPTIYNGIRMRSRLEAGFAAWLDIQTTFKWEYEPCAFATSAGQYLPDFRLENVASHGEMHHAYVEVKPPPHFYETGEGDDYDEAAWERREAVWAQMGGIWSSDPEALLLIAGPGHLNRLYMDLYVQGPWAIDAAWTSGPDGVDGVAVIAGPESVPWPPNWWKGQRAADS